MQINRVFLVYFSGTGTTQTTVRQIGAPLGAALGLAEKRFPFRSPGIAEVPHIYP